MQAKISETRLRTELQPMRHLWPGIEADLIGLGVNSLMDLRGRDPEELFNTYCTYTRQQHDLCIFDMFTSLVTFARTGEPRPWWRYTRDRSFQQHSKRISDLMGEGTKH